MKKNQRKWSQYIIIDELLTKSIAYTILYGILLHLINDFNWFNGMKVNESIVKNARLMFYN